MRRGGTEAHKKPSSCRLQVRVTPRSSRDRIEGAADGVIRVRVTAPPAEGRANRALVRLLADALGVSKSRVAIEKGGKSRLKTIRVDGLTEADARERLGLG